MAHSLEKDRTPENYWRAVILFGQNVDSYKFALAKSLIELSTHGSEPGPYRRQGGPADAAQSGGAGACSPQVWPQWQRCCSRKKYAQPIRPQEQAAERGLQTHRVLMGSCTCDVSIRLYLVSSDGRKGSRARPPDCTRRFLIFTQLVASGV
jgi:hypothetical protein